MAQNLLPNDDGGLKFALWTPVATGAATSPTGTYGATGGADSLPEIQLAASGTSGGVAMQATVNVEQETILALGFVGNSSSASANIVPFSVAYTDANGNAIVTHVPTASAASVAAATEYTD
jgi:hypothetical protein